MPDPKRPLKVFLCHASADKPKVRELYRYLRKRGVKPWFDEVDLVGGQNWRVEIPKAIRSSDAIIICLTKNSVDKEGYIQSEIKFALDKALEMPEGRIFLIPARFEDCKVPYKLEDFHWVDLFDEVGYSRMMKTLKFRAAQLERATVELPITPVVDEPKNVVLVNEQESIERAVRESTEREAAEKAAEERAERESAEKAEREKAKKAAQEKAAQQKIEKEIQREYERMIKKAKRDLWWGRLKIDIQYRLELLRIYRAPILILLVALAIMIPLSLDLYDKFPELTQALNNTPTITVASTTIVEPSSSPEDVNTPVPTPLFVCVYTVARMQSFNDVALIFDVNRDLIQDINGNMIDNQNQDFAGQSLIIPNVAQDVCERGHGGFVHFPVSVEDIPEPVPTEITDAKGVSMALVPAGEFTMGSEYDLRDESPSRQVYIDNFYIDKYEVTNRFYSACVDVGVCQPPQDRSSKTRPSYFGEHDFDDYPVIYVAWTQAKTYCEWRGENLPTEAQWEKAARGPNERIYPWGNDQPSCEHANYYSSSGRCKGDTVQVGSYSVNQSDYGVYDMAGNVWEWTADWYSSNSYRNMDLVNPLGPESGNSRVIRGGGWEYISNELTVSSSNRYYQLPELSSNDVGFRCARSLDESVTANEPAIPITSPTIPATYTLQKEEYTYCIARRFNLDPTALLQASGLEGSDVYYAGLVLTIPQNSTWPVQELGSRALRGHPVTYTVIGNSDTTVYGVACKFGDVFPEDIAALNDIAMDAALSQGQVLQIP